MSDSDPVLPRPRRRARETERKKGLEGNEVITMAQKAKEAEQVGPIYRKRAKKPLLILRPPQKGLDGKQVSPSVQKAKEAGYVNEVPRTDMNTEEAMDLNRTDRKATEAELVNQVTTTAPNPKEAEQVNQETIMDKGNGNASLIGGVSRIDGKSQEAEHLNHVNTTNEGTEAAVVSDDATILSEDSSEETVEDNPMPTTERETKEALNANPSRTVAEIALVTFLPNQSPIFWIREPSQLSGQAGDDGRLFRTSVRHLVDEPWRVELLRHLLSGGRPRFDVIRETAADDTHVFPQRLKDLNGHIAREGDTRVTDNETQVFFADLEKKLDNMYRELGGDTEEELRMGKRAESPSADGYREFLADLGLWLPVQGSGEPDRGLWFRESEPESE